MSCEDRERLWHYTVTFKSLLKSTPSDIQIDSWPSEKFTLSQMYIIMYVSGADVSDADQSCLPPSLSHVNEIAFGTASSRFAIVLKGNSETQTLSMDEWGNCDY